MEPKLKNCLKAITLELRRGLEGHYDANGTWQPGDLERRLGEIGVWRDRPARPAGELTYRSGEDREARRVVDAFLKSRAEAELDRAQTVEEFVREAAYSWANRLLALRCMEARGLIDEVILQKEVYGGRSLQHQRLAKKAPDRCTGEDEGLFAVLFDEFERRAGELPLLFSPHAPEVALRPSVAAIKHCIGLLSGSVVPKGQEPATDEVFSAPDALGWAYQYWNTEEKDRVFEKVRTKKGAKIEGAEIIPATCIYTEPYMVKFLVQNSLGGMWMGMYPASRLCDSMEYYVRDADRAAVTRKAVRDIAFLDLACGSGHFLIEGFDLFYAMYLEEGETTDPAAICTAILEHNLYGIDIDERAVQMAALALVMKAREKTLDFVPRRVNLVATNIRLPVRKEHLEAFLKKHPEDAPLKPALLAIFESLAHADELGSLLQIEEPVEKELQYIRHKLGAQLSLGGPQTDEEWSAWKHRTIHRLQQHFDVEAHGTDAVDAFFGEAGAKGLSLVDLLCRRYDVVAANPPYMGSKQMGDVTREYLELHYGSGKRDLYAAFVLRGLDLLEPSGRLAFLTQQSWMFLGSFEQMRCQLLSGGGFEAMAHLGPRTFYELSNTNALGFTMFVHAQALPSSSNGVFLRLVHAIDKNAALLEVLKPANGSDGRLRGKFLIPGSVLFQIPCHALFYWAPPAVRALFTDQKAKLGSVAAAKQGLITGDNDRFLRFWWEVGENLGRRWIHYYKGGPFRRWHGNESYVVDWDADGVRIRNLVGANGRLRSRPQNMQFYFREGATWTAQSSYGFSLRYMMGGCIFDAKGPGLFPYRASDLWFLLGVCNTHLFEYLFLGVQPTVDFGEGYLESLPTPVSAARIQRELIGRLAIAATELKRIETREQLTERTFVNWKWALGSSLEQVVERIEELGLRRNLVISLLETALAHEVHGAYGLAEEDLAEMYSDRGVPFLFFPRLAETDGDTTLSELDPELVTVVQATIKSLPVTSRDFPELSSIASQIATAYLSTRSYEEGHEERTNLAEDGETSLAGVAVPTETVLESLSQEVGLHPVSIYSLLVHGLREQKQVVSQERRRVVEDLFSATVLSLLGVRWPKEIEAGDGIALDADRDGIVPITAGLEDPTLLARIRKRMAANFGADQVGAIEREFNRIIGKPLDQWLSSDFFRRHVSQFKKRPVVWQIISPPNRNQGRRGKGGRRGEVAFSCLVYCQRMDADLLPKLRTQYVGPLRSRFQTELVGLERITARTPDQDERRVELEAKIEELRAFDARLEEVIVGGFGSTALDTIAAKEPLDKWISRDGHAPPPASRDAFVAQEQRYDPDLNDGVRVNIAPLQMAGLLGADVLAAKDVEKAIADRAEWRADERRWCREGKLPRPGWWPEGSP